MLLKLHLVEPDGKMMDLTSTSFQIGEQPDTIFTPEGPMIDSFEKSLELKMIKQMLEKTEAGQTGAGYDKIIDKIFNQNQALPGN